MYEKFSQAYFDKGLAVLPLQGKRPFTSDWVKHDFEQDENDYKGKNIGLKTGAPSGVICIDIDTTDNALKDKIYALLPPLYSGKIGNQEKGINYFFAYNGETNRKIGGAVEILSTGNQTVLPPSIHPDIHKPYEWRGQPLIDIDPDDLPHLPDNFIEEIEKLLDVKSSQIEITDSDGSRCNHNSHNKISQMMVAMLHDGEPPQDIVSKLIEYDKEINDKVSYFLCPSRKWRSSIAVTNAYKLVTEAMERLERTGELTRVNTEKVAVSIGEVVTKERTREKYPKFRGIAQDMFQYIYKSAPVPRSRLACASVLSLISTTLANKITIDGIYPNLYSLMLADSGAGKDFPLSFPKQALAESGAKNLIGQSMPASDSGIIKTLPGQPERLDSIDEASSLFGAISDNRNQYATKMGDVYANLYTSTGKFYEGKVLAGKEKVMGECHSPYISILAAMTPEAAQETLSHHIIQTGLGARFLFFIDNEKKRGRRVKANPEIPQNIKNFIKMWRSESETEQISIKSGFNKPAPRQAKIEDESALDKIFDDIEKMKEGADKRVVPLLNRAYVNICKLALIDACSTQCMSKDITVKKENLEWAQEFFRVNFIEATEFIFDSVSGSRREKDLNKVHEFIKSKREQGATKSDLAKGLRMFNARYRQEIIEDLQSAGHLLVQKNESAGRPTFTFFSSKYVHSGEGEIQ